MVGLVSLVGTIERHNRNIATLFAGVAALLLLVEQRMVMTPAFLSCHEDSRLLARIPVVPSTCRSFFVEGNVTYNMNSPLIEFFYAPTTEAMLVAARDHVPTLNGISTVSPSNWELMPPLGDKYIPAVKSWIDRYDLKNVCRLDLWQLSWNIKPFADR